MSERQAYLGQRVEIRQKRQRQSVNCAALKDRLRSLLPAIAEPQQLNRDEILNAAASLHSELGELEVLDRQLAILNAELGE